MPQIKVHDIAYVAFRAPDLDAMEAYLTEFGLVRAARDADALFMRGVGPSPFLHVTRRGDPGFAGVAFEATGLDDLHRLAMAEGVAPRPVEGPGGGTMITLSDPDGFRVDVVAGRAPAVEIPTRAPQPMNDARDRARVNDVKRTGYGPSHVRRLGHCVLNVGDFAASRAWYQSRFGFIASDEITAPPGPPPPGLAPAGGGPIGAFLRCDRGDRPTDHHTLFLLGTGAPAYNHAAFEVLDVDDLMRGHSYLRDRAREPEWGVGRHFLGSQIFDYWKDPWGHTVEHWTDGDQLDAGWGSRVAPFADLIGVQWGAPFPHLPPPAPD